MLVNVNCKCNNSWLLHLVTMVHCCAGLLAAESSAKARCKRRTGACAAEVVNESVTRNAERECTVRVSDDGVQR